MTGTAGAASALAVRLPNWLGDTILARRAVDSLAARFADRRLVLVARPWASELFAATWPGAEWLEAPTSGGRWLSAVPALRRAGVEMCVVFPPSLSARLHAFAAGVPRRLGLGGEMGDFLLTARAPRGARGLRHLEDEYLDVARVAGASALAARALVAPERGLAAARALLAEALGTAPRPFLAVAPGARYGPAKRWPAERFAEAARLWAGPRGADVVVLGGLEDVAAAASVVAASPRGPGRTVSLAGRTDVAGLAGILALAGGALSNDSGTAHLAAALGRPTVAIFGSTDPRWTGPRGPAVRLLAAPPACAPCYRRRCGIPDRYLCLRALSAEAAAETLDELTATPAASTP